MDGPWPMPMPPEDPTPGASSDTFNTPLPTEATGRVDSDSVSNVVDRFSEVVSSTTVEFALTSTVVALPPTPKVTSAVDVLFRSTATPLTVIG